MQWNVSSPNRNLFGQVPDQQPFSQPNRRRQFWQQPNRQQPYQQPPNRRQQNQRQQFPFSQVPQRQPFYQTPMSQTPQRQPFWQTPLSQPGTENPNMGLLQSMLSQMPQFPGGQRQTFGFNPGRTFGFDPGDSQMSDLSGLLQRLKQMFGG